MEKKQRKERSDKGKKRSTRVIISMRLQLDKDVYDYMTTARGSLSYNKYINNLIRKERDNETK